jgi:FkbM family methyltransferase
MENNAMTAATLAVPFKGKEIILDPANGTDYVVEAFARGEFEKPLPEIFAEAISETKGNFIDVGAHSGLYSLIAAHVRRDLKIDSFEPNPIVLDALRRNISLNGANDRITVHAIALSDRNVNAPLHMPTVNHGFDIVTSASLQGDFQPWNRTVEVQCARLDDIDLPESPGIIKADIEGHEHAFLAGAMETLRRCRPLIFLEVLSVGRVDDLNAVRQKLEYVDIRLQPDRAIVGGTVEFDAQAWNHAWVPIEKLNDFTSLLHRVGLVVQFVDGPGFVQIMKRLIYRSMSFSSG